MYQNAGMPANDSEMIKNGYALNLFFFIKPGHDFVGNIYTSASSIKRVSQVSAIIGFLCFP